MERFELALVCPLCSHDWVADLAAATSQPRPPRPNGRQVRLYRLRCPICDHVIMVEVESGEEQAP